MHAEYIENWSLTYGVYVTGNPGNRAIRVLPGIFGQYAYYPFQSGNTRIDQNFWAIRVLPSFEGRAIPVLPDSFKSGLLNPTISPIFSFALAFQLYLWGKTDPTTNLADDLKIVVPTF